MSKLSEFLTNIANAIRNLKGTTEPINAQNFATEINSMKEALNDTTATPEDIVLGKTAFVKGQKVEGTYKTPTTLKKLFDYTKSCYRLFYNNTTITDLTGYISNEDTSNVTDTGDMFYNCSNLKIVPPLDMSKVINGNSMFESCSSLTTVELLNTGKLQRANGMFSGCSSLTPSISIDTRSMTYPYRMFSGCRSLISISLTDVRKFGDTGQMFSNCSKLTNLTLKNLKRQLQVGSGSSWGHLLTLESLIGLCQECVNVNSSRKLTVGTANINKLANVYVKLTNQPEEDETLPKIPMVQCESTDEGAMLISEYMALKNWTLG